MFLLGFDSRLKDLNQKILWKFSFVIFYTFCVRILYRSMYIKYNLLYLLCKNSLHIFGVSRIQSVKNFVICVIEKILIFVTVVFPKIHSCLSVSSGWLTFLNIYNIYIYNIYIIYILHIYIINIYIVYIQEGQYIYI